MRQSLPRIFFLCFRPTYPSSGGSPAVECTTTTVSMVETITRLVNIKLLRCTTVPTTKTITRSVNIKFLRCAAVSTVETIIRSVNIQLLRCKTTTLYTFPQRKLLPGQLISNYRDVKLKPFLRRKLLPGPLISWYTFTQKICFIPFFDEKITQKRPVGTLVYQDTASRFLGIP